MWDVHGFSSQFIRLELSGTTMVQWPKRWQEAVSGAPSANSAGLRTWTSEVLHATDLAVPLKMVNVG